MARKKKLATPDWIIEGFDSPADYNKAKGIKKEKKKVEEPAEQPKEESKTEEDNAAKKPHMSTQTTGLTKQ